MTAQATARTACATCQRGSTDVLIAGSWDALRTIVRTEGVLALYKGLAPTLVRPAH